MRIELHGYKCDVCGLLGPLRTSDEQAWTAARDDGWTRTDLPIDGTGHVGRSHFCSADAPVPQVVTFTG